MDKISHHVGNHCLWVFAAKSSFQGFLGGAGFRPSTVSLSTWEGDPWKGAGFGAFGRYANRPFGLEMISAGKPCLVAPKSDHL